MTDHLGHRGDSLRDAIREREAHYDDDMDAYADAALRAAAAVSRLVDPYLTTAEGEVQYAWLVWGRKQGQSQPLGCYGTREVALEAESLMKAHRNASKWEDIWVTPWPLSMKPSVNFRMEMD